MRLYGELWKIVRFYVCAGTKRPLSRAGENSNAQRRIIAILAQYLGEQPVRFTITSVEPLGTVERHIRQRTFFLEQDFHKYTFCSVLLREVVSHQPSATRIASLSH